MRRIKSSRSGCSMANPDQAITEKAQPTSGPEAKARAATAAPLRLKPGRILLYLVLIAGALVAVFPFFWMISNSLMTLGETLNRQWLPEVPQFQNYLDAWDQANFAKYFWNTVVITFVTCAGLLITSILSGYAFARINFVGRNLIFALLLSTLMIPESVTIIPSF